MPGDGACHEAVVVLVSQPREIEQIIELRRVHHRTEDRIRAYVILCWRRCCWSGSPKRVPGGSGSSAREQL